MKSAKYQIKDEKVRFQRPENGEQIVITGMSGKLPDSHDVYHFRDNLFNKVDMVSDDHRRWIPFHPEIPQRLGKLYDIEKFDRGFFGVTHAQSDHMDPMLRMLMERVYETIIDAGHNPADFEETNTAVIIGFSMSTTTNSLSCSTETNFNDTMTGSQSSMMAGRISYYLKLKGSSFTADTACSSSMFALEEAYRKLLRGECDKAIVASSHLCLHPMVSLQFSRLGVLSLDGACKSFDVAGNGYARGEGVMAILLERAKDAKRIYAEVIHTKTSCDGHKAEGITFPSTEDQRLLLRELYEEIQVDPTTLTYMEAHATGTIVGDPEEVNSLDEIFCKGRKTPLLIGAVKSNIGHNEPASGLSSIIKVLIAMETGFIPPNLHFNEPREGVEGLVKKRMIVVAEKTPLPDDRGLFGINSFGFGGANAHLLLRWNTKAKTNDGIPADNLPRLICVQGRTEEAVTSILDDVGNRPLDAEHVYLIHQAFRKQVENNLYRGFGIFTKVGEVKRSLRKINTETPKLYLVFNNFENNWLKLGHQLRELPIFNNTIKCIQSILHEATNIDFYKIFRDPGEATLANQILGTVAVQISLADVFKSIQLIPDRIIGIGSGELVAAYVDNYLTLRQAVLGTFFIVSCLRNKTSRNWEALQENLPNRKNSYSKWIPSEEQRLGQGSAKYFLSNITKSANGIGQLIPKDAVPLIIGADIKGASNRAIPLVDINSKDVVLELLNNLGCLYEYGFDMELNKLYPSVSLPVSRGTPMLSPLIKWQHADCDVYVYHNETEFNNEHNLMRISVKNDDWNFIVGHVIDGRNLFPATGYLILVWEAFASRMGMLLSEMRIVFEDVKYLRATNVPKDDSLELMVTIQRSTHYFEVTEGGVTIVTGKIYNKADEQVLHDFPAEAFDEDELCMQEKDIYKELKLRGYHYSGLFRSVNQCSVDSSQAIVHWDSNWISFLDCLLQVIIMQSDTRNLYVPTSIGQLMIDAPKHIESCKTYNNRIPTRFYKNLNIIRTEGIELRRMGASVIPRRKGGDPVLEISKFVPNETQRDLPDSIKIFVQIVWENTNALKVKVVEACPDEFEESKLLSPVVQEALDGLPSIKQELTILTNKKMEISTISVLNKSLNTESNCALLIVTKILENIEVDVAINAVTGAKGYIISRESLNTDLSKFSGSQFNVICNHKNTEEMLVLLKPIDKSSVSISYFDTTNTLTDFQWITGLQEQIKNNDKVVLYSQYEDVNGLLGLSTCLQQEHSGSKIKCFLIVDDAPKFEPDLEFYRKQLDKDMAVNVWKDGAWGTYRHLSLPVHQTVETEHIYANVTTKGDLSTLTWLEGTIKPDEEESMELEQDLIYVYYSAINFKDLMTATGKLAVDFVTLDRIQQECVQGFEFAGRNSKGKRIMGMCNNGALATIVKCDRRMTFEIPEKWSMEDASTAVVVYLTVLQAFDGCELKPGKSILIHSGTGGIGLAAINICEHYGLEIFVTVGTAEKRDYLRKHYPQIKEEHIGNSRDTSFEAMVQQNTDGAGVDYVLNSLAEEKLLASVRCLAKGGRFLEIGKFDLSNNNALALNLLEKNAQFVGIALDNFIEKYNTSVLNISNWFTELVKKGAVRPLPKTVFKQNEVEQAFRYMGLGKHIGKVVIKIRDEEDGRKCSVPRTLFKATPRFYCNPKSSYLLCGGLGGFGLELADLLVVRGAKNLILTSTSGLCNGYQKYRIRIWESYGVKVLTTTLNASTEESCTELLKAANELSPLEGIFNLAAVLKDALFENQTEENFELSLKPKAYCTKNLDSISRKLCPNLRYFVVFSSISCGRGNAGQTNYGMANSVMERICEKRKKEGYPALAIQWGAIGEVGLVAKMQEDHKELIIGGTLQQKISNCLQVLDQLMEQDEPIVGSMVVAEKQYGGRADNMFDAVLNILGISNLKSVSVHSTFPELGMDSMMAVEIKQTLEREHEVFLTAQDIKGMTLSKLSGLTRTQDVDVAVQNQSSQVEIPDAINLMLRYIGTEELSAEPVVRMKTSVEDTAHAPHILALPGLEGMATVFEVLCKSLKAHVSCLQFCPEMKTESITQLACSILPHFEAVADNLIILAYSFGCLVAVELLHMLEASGKQARVIFLDGAPDVLVRLTKLYFTSDDENSIQNEILSAIMSRYVSHSIIENHQKHLMTLNTYQEKIVYMINVAPFDVDVSTKHIIDMCIATYEKLYAIHKHTLRENKLKSRITLFKASSNLIANAAADYALSSTFENLEGVVIVEGNHATILDNEELPKEINKILGGF